MFVRCPTYGKDSAESCIQGGKRLEAQYIVFSGSRSPTLAIKYLEDI